MNTIINYFKHITIFFFIMLFSCLLKAQTRSPFSCLEFCKDGEKVIFTYNFKNSNIDSISFIISDIFGGNENLITFKKNRKNIDTIDLKMDFPYNIPSICIKYFDNGKEKSREVNLKLYPCKGKGPSKKNGSRVNKRKIVVNNQ